MTCPLTYCFDCAPDAYTAGSAVRTAAASATAALLEKRGVSSTKSFLFFACDDCKTEGRRPPAPPAAPPVVPPVQPPMPAPPTQAPPTQAQPTQVPSMPPPPVQPPAPLLPPPTHSPEVTAVSRRARKPQFPPTTRTHLSIVSELHAYMRLNQLNQHRLGERIGKKFSKVSDWQQGRMGDRAQARMDARVAAYLEEPERFAATFAEQLAARRQGVQPVEAFVPATSRSHDELVAEVKAHMAHENLSQASLAQRVARTGGHVSQWMSGRLGASADARFAAYLRDPAAFMAQLAALVTEESDAAAPPSGEVRTSASKAPTSASSLAIRSTSLAAPSQALPSSAKKRPRHEQYTTPPLPTDTPPPTDKPPPTANPAAAASLMTFLVAKGVCKSKLDGWFAMSQARACGASQAQTDTYYFSPEGLKFRSRTEVLRSLA